MINFKKFNSNDYKTFSCFNQYFQQYKSFLSFYSVGNMFYFQEYAKDIEYSIINCCLVFKYYLHDSLFFSFPISIKQDPADTKKALIQISDYCLKEHIKLQFNQIANKDLLILNEIFYLKNEISCPRWKCEYLYDAIEFVNHKTSAYQRIRNLIAKFNKQKLNYEIHELNEKNINLAVDFINEFWNKNPNLDDMKSLSAKVEKQMSQAYTQIKSLDGMVLTINGLTAAICIVEPINDTLLCHIEKVNHQYQGLGAFFLTEYISYFIKKYNIKYFNRIDDAASIGLRRSKLQYHPLSLVKSFKFKPSTCFINITRNDEIKTKRLDLKDIYKNNTNYLRLCSDENINKYYGWDYQTSFNKNNHNQPSINLEWFLIERNEDFKNQNEASWGIYLDNQLIGEVCLYDFSYDNQCSIGYRLLPEYQGHGYAIEAVKEMIKYAFIELGINKINCKCFVENKKSKTLIERLGMKFICNDDKYYFYYLSPEMNF